MSYLRCNLKIDNMLFHFARNFVVNTLQNLYRLAQQVECSITELFYQDDCGRTNGVLPIVEYAYLEP